MTPIRKRSLVIIGIVLMSISVALLVTGMLPRVRSDRALAAAADEVRNAVPDVYVTQPKPAPEAELLLAATTQAFRDAIVYARTSGYVSHRYVDIGDHVKAGQLLAEIASPEIDQELSQAKAQFRQSRKTLELQQTARELAQVTKGRYQAADAERAVAKEMVDQSVASEKTAAANVAAAEANVDSNVANVNRLAAMTAFERVTAPFEGTVTRRNIDDGALITAGSPMSGGAVGDSVGGLFEIAQLDALRVFVNVPQVDAANVKLGMPVQISVRGRMMQPVQGKVTRTANALDATTRTLLAEIDIDNKAHALFPGMFVYVGFKITPAGTRWRVPATAVIVDSEGTRVVTIAQGNKLHYQPVMLGRDFGASIDIQAGLQGDETLVAQPRVSMQEGQVVRPRAAKGAAKGGGEPSTANGVADKPAANGGADKPAANGGGESSPAGSASAGSANPGTRAK
jgi:RND family efflux transporter MFP subunit